MMPGASRRTAWAALAVSLFIYAGLVSVQVNQRMDTGFLRIWLLDLLAPLENVVDFPTRSVKNFWNRYLNLVDLQARNEALKAENDALRTRIDRQREELEEARRLRLLLSVADGAELRTTVARVIGRDPTNFHRTITIDKGRSHGVGPDTAVMTSSGVVGRVIHAGNFYSVVQLIVDAQSGVAVLVKSSRRQAIVKGSGGSELELDYIEDDNDIEPGDELVTSGLDRIYPKGLPVGVVAAVGPRKGMFKLVSIRPMSDLERLEEVVCVLDRPSVVDASPSALAEPRS